MQARAPKKLYKLIPGLIPRCYDAMALQLGLASLKVTTMTLQFTSNMQGRPPLKLYRSMLTF